MSQKVKYLQITLTTQLLLVGVPRSVIPVNRNATTPYATSFRRRLSRIIMLLNTLIQVSTYHAAKILKIGLQIKI